MAITGKPYVCTYCSDDVAFKIKIEYNEPDKSLTNRITVVCLGCAVEALFMYNQVDYVSLTEKTVVHYGLTTCEVCKSQIFSILIGGDPKTDEYTGTIWIKCIECDHIDTLALQTIVNLIDDKESPFDILK